MEVSGVDILSSAQKASAGLVVVAMKPYAERDTTIQDIIPMIQGLGPKFPDATVMAFQRLHCLALPAPVLSACTL